MTPRLGIPDLGIRHALLLQGPMGPFSRRFADDLRAAEISVTKVNLNAGDALFFRGPEAIAYRGTRGAFADFVRDLIAQRGIDGLIVFGDGRPYHRAAIEVARELSLPVLVLEEGYLRPNHVTVEREGVNGFSRLPRDPEAYRPFADVDTGPVTPAGRSFRYAGWYATLYAIALTFGRIAYPHYRHHRPLNAFVEAYRWVLSGARKLWYAHWERDVIETLLSSHDGRYFVLALQVHCDFQLEHSRFTSVDAFIEETVASFAAHAPRDQKLVVKHHPLDRAYRDYSRLIARLRREHGLEDRLVYVHDLHLPTLLKHCRGTVMINSTVGLQALEYGTPTKILGTAIYDLPGMTDQASLEQFWKHPKGPDPVLVRGFCNYLLLENQVNGNFYLPLEGTERGAGLIWPKTWGEKSALIRKRV